MSDAHESGPGRAAGAPGPLSSELHEVWTAEPPAVALARARVTALAREAGATSHVIEDIRLAISEAATNVVVHAYVGLPTGPLVVRARVRERRLVVEVGDAGAGIRARADSPGLGIGLPLISAVTESVRTSSDGPENNRVIMTFHLDAVRTPIA